MIPINFIGAMPFIFLRGAVDPYAEGTRIAARGGVDHVSLFRTGQRGRPFRLRSGTDAPNYNTAWSLWRAYRALIAAGPLRLVINGLDMGGADFRLVVLDCRQVALRQHVLNEGGLYAASTGWIEADWTLIAVPFAT